MFDTVPEVDRYRRMMDGLCEIVAVRYGGSLKARQTGRRRVPENRREKRTDEGGR
jgi:hypothetical protein